MMAAYVRPVGPSLQVYSDNGNGRSGGRILLQDFNRARQKLVDAYTIKGRCAAHNSLRHQRRFTGDVTTELRLQRGLWVASYLLVAQKLQPHLPRATGTCLSESAGCPGTHLVTADGRTSSPQQQHSSSQYYSTPL